MSINKKYRIFQVGFFVMLGIFAVTVYANYDYWVFKILIAKNYVFTEALDEFYGRHIAEENRRSYFRDFDRVVISSVTGELSAIANDRYTYLYTPEALDYSREIDKEIARTAEITELSEETVYMYIPNISRITRKFVQENRAFLARYPNLILDLRGNYGGWLPDYEKIADLFTAKGDVLNFWDTRSSLFSRTITSSGSAYFNFENIIILQDGNTASAAECLILALRGNVPGVTAIGQTTFGKGIGQVTIPLTGGYAVRATVLRVLGPEREFIHRTGIAPDIELETDVDMLEFAIDLIS